MSDRVMPGPAPSIVRRRPSPAEHGAGDHAPAPVGGPLVTPTYLALLAIAALGGLIALWRFVNGLGAVTNLNQGYPWGIWIAIDVVTGTALGCGGYAVALLVYILNKGEYHPLVRPAVLTSLLGYGLAVLAVAIDLGRFWELWKVPIFFWRWTHSPQLEVALCVATYVAVLLVELSPALFEKWRTSTKAGLRRWSERGLRVLDRALIWILALGLLLPTMHQSSLGTMMLLPATKMHPLWFTPWLPLLFLVNCVILGYGAVVLESHISSHAFNRRPETAMLARLSSIVMYVTIAWLAFRLITVAGPAAFGTIGTGRGFMFLVEVALHVCAIAMLASPARRRTPGGQFRAGLLLVGAGALYRVNTYLVAFQPGPQWSYFPAVPEVLITFGILALEALLYITAVKMLPILGGVRRPAAA